MAEEEGSTDKGNILKEGTRVCSCSLQQDLVQHANTAGLDGCLLSRVQLVADPNFFRELFKPRVRPILRVNVNLNAGERGGKCD